MSIVVPAWPGLQPIKTQRQKVSPVSVNKNTPSPWALAMRPSSRNCNPASDLGRSKLISQPVFLSRGVFFPQTPAGPFRRRRIAPRVGYLCTHTHAHPAFPGLLLWPATLKMAHARGNRLSNTTSLTHYVSLIHLLSEPRVQPIYMYIYIYIYIERERYTHLTYVNYNIYHLLAALLWVGFVSWFRFIGNWSVTKTCLYIYIYNNNNTIPGLLVIGR